MCHWVEPVELKRIQKSRPVAASSGSLIGSSNNIDNNNQHLKTIYNQTNTKELLCRTITIRNNRATSLLIQKTTGAFSFHLWYTIIRNILARVQTAACRSRPCFVLSQWWSGEDKAYLLTPGIWPILTNICKRFYKLIKFTLSHVRVGNSNKIAKFSVQKIQASPYSSNPPPPPPTHTHTHIQLFRWRTFCEKRVTLVVLFCIFFGRYHQF